MTIQYRQGPKYVCNHLYQGRRLPVCQSTGAARVDAAVAAVFWQALAPVELDLFEQAQRQLAAEAEQIQKVQAQQLQRLRYQVRLGERQYQACDPDNRLVAAELERRWEQSLRELRDAEEQQEREAKTMSKISQLTPALRQAWQRAGAQLPQLWNDGRLNACQKKTLLRSLIQKVVLQRTTPGQAKLRIVWKGDAVTELEIALRVAAWSSLPNAAETQSEILRLARAGFSDEWIAYSISQEGCRSSFVEHVPVFTVARLRLKHQIPSPARRLPPPPQGWLTLWQASRRTGIHQSSIMDMILQGSLRLPVEEPSKRFLFPDEREVLEKLKSLGNREIDHLHIT